MRKQISISPLPSLGGRKSKGRVRGRSRVEGWRMEDVKMVGAKERGRAKNKKTVEREQNLPGGKSAGGGHPTLRGGCWIPGDSHTPSISVTGTRFYGA